MKGIYCLLINVKKDIRVSVGALGTIFFKKGRYVYVGSAQNSVEKRVARHFRKKGKKLKWHIDYLLNSRNASIEKAVYKNAGKEQECKLACLLSKFEEPVNGFGCSDCRCLSHLYRLKKLNLTKLGMKNIITNK